MEEEEVKEVEEVREIKERREIGSGNLKMENRNWKFGRSPWPTWRGREGRAESRRRVASPPGFL